MHARKAATKIYPDLIIAGAPKCGTTSVFDWLSGHPEVCPSSVKETYFLMDEGYPLFRPENNYHKNGLDGYGLFFSHCTDERRFLLEATPDYLYQETALDVISSLPSVPKILFILRKPSDRIYSLYQFARNNVSVLDKKINFRSFIEALMEGHSDNTLNNRPLLQKAIKHSQYVDYIEPWHTRLNGHFNVYLFEDVRDSPQKFMLDMAEDMGINPKYFESFDFNIKNKTYSVRHQTTHKIKKNLSAIMPHGKYREILRKVYALLNTEAAPQKSSDDVEVLKMLDYHFADYNTRLEKLLDIDLSAWRK